MGIQLDWDYEVGEERRHQREGEDPLSRRQRRRRWRHLLLFLLLLLLLTALLAGAALWRLREQERYRETVLRATIDTELTALRMGDRRAWLELQSDTDAAWRRERAAEFTHIQALKAASRLQPGGLVEPLVMDGTRARVRLRETRDDVAWTRVAFYRQEKAGWRRVPPDTDFRGDSARIVRDSLLIEYQTVDEPLAQALADTLPGWLAEGCGLLDCAATPQLVVQIRTMLDAPAWSPRAAWLLLLPSPWRDLTRVDMPLAPVLRERLAELLAARLARQFAAGADAGVPEQLVARFLESP